MKRFKFWLVWLFGLLFWLTSFSSAWSYWTFSFTRWYFDWSVWNYSYSKSISSSELLCYHVADFDDWSLSCTDNYWNIVNGSKFRCYTNIDLVFNCYKSSSKGRALEYMTITWLDNNCPTCSPQYTSQECQSVYWLVSSWLLNECESDLLSCQSSISWYDSTLNVCTNNLNNCTTNLSNCLEWNWSNIQWSSLFINDIQHIWAPLINITIPEEINWDYTWNDEDFIINISWYNVDTDYIAWIITTQNSKPNNVDFNNIVSWLIPLLVPWLVLIAFIYFVFRFIKKIF